MKRRGALLVAALLGLGMSACEDEVPPPIVRTLDGPTDLAFACHGRMRVTQGEAATDAQPIVTSSMPVEACQGWNEVRARLDEGAVVDDGDDKDDRYFLVGMPPAGQGPLDLVPEQRLDEEERTELFQEWQAKVNLYGFALQKNQGTVALVRQGLNTTANVVLQDADPFSPGLNVIPVGTQPVGITADPTGCHVTTANAGSCDLSVLDVATVLSGETVPVVRRMPVQNAAGEVISAKPRAIVGQVGSAPLGFECAGAPDSLVYVAFPDCNAVAAVHTGTGEIRASIVFAEDGSAVLGDGNLTCAAATCGGPTTPPVAETPDAGVLDASVPDASVPDASVPDAGAPDAGAGVGIAAVGGRPRPVALHMAADGGRLYIGAENSPRVTVVELDPAVALPTATWSVALEGEVGVTSLAATELIAMGGDVGRADEGPFGDFRFVYAAATDNTVRVAEVHEQRRECETQADPRYLHEVLDGKLLSCLPVGDPTLPRRIETDRSCGANCRPRSPGIHMPGNARPLDIVFARGPGLEEATADTARRPISPTVLIGTFAYISLSTGEVVVVNVDDDNYGDVESVDVPADVDLSLALPHQLRDETAGRYSSRYCIEKGKPVPEEGEDPPPPAYYPLECATFTTTTTLAGCSYPAGAPQGQPSITTGGQITQAPGYVASSYTGALPKLRNVECITPFVAAVPPSDDDPDGTPAIQPESVAVPELSVMAPDPLRELVFPDLQSVRALETWNIAWEGALSRPDVIGIDATTRVGFLEVGSDVVLRDGASPFCEMGAEPGDVVSLVGCNPTFGGNDCRTGEVCAVVPEVALDEQRGICVPEAREREFLDTCTSFLSSKRRYTIAEAHSDRLVLAERKRVLRTTPVDGCSSAAQCAGLYELELLLAVNDSDAAEDEPPPPIAVESPASTDRWACEPEPVRAPDRNVCLMTCDSDDDCEAGAGWRCSGEGYCVEATLPPAECVESLLRYEVRGGDAFIVNGSLTGFVHDRIADVVTGECVSDPFASPLANARVPLTAPPCTGDGFTDIAPNPCTTTVSQFETDGARDARAIRVRTPAFVTHLVDPLLDPASQGIECTLDGAACPAMLAVPPNYVITFTIVAGFSPLRAATEFVYPLGLVNDPLGDVWIIDQGDVASTIRGQMAKLSPLNLVLLSLLQ